MSKITYVSSGVECPVCGALMAAFVNTIIDCFSGPDGLRYEWLITCENCHMVSFKVPTESLAEAAAIVQAKIAKGVSDR